MKQSRAVFLAFMVVSVLLSGSVLAQETHEVHMNLMPVEGRPIPEFFFQPTGLLIQPGDTVTFVANTPHHTATAYHPQHVKTQRVPEGVEPFSSPIVPIHGTWDYTFTEPGVYDLWCGPHEQYGMAMRIVVGEATGPGMEPITDFGPEGVFATAGTVLSDPALDPLNIVSAGQVMWEELAPESKALSAPPGE